MNKLLIILSVLLLSCGGADVNYGNHKVGSPKKFKVDGFNFERIYFPDGHEYYIGNSGSQRGYMAHAGSCSHKSHQMVVHDTIKVYVKVFVHDTITVHDTVIVDRNAEIRDLMLEYLKDE